MITEISGFCFLKFLNVKTKHFDVDIEAVHTINCSIHTRVTSSLGWVLIWKLSS